MIPIDESLSQRDSQRDTFGIVVYSISANIHYDNKLIELKCGTFEEFCRWKKALIQVFRWS